MTHQVLISKKKTCTPERLIKVLSAIADLGITYEGEGGKTQGWIGGGYGDGDYYVGTGLRAPDMPFYYKPKATRHSILKHLEENGLILIKNKEDDSEWTDFEVTVQGLIILEAYTADMDWYKVTSYNQIGERLIAKSSSRMLLTKEKAMKYEAYEQTTIEPIKSKRDAQ